MIMRRIEFVEQINASPQEVWDYISDIEKAPQWVTVMQSLLETTDNPVRKGTVYTERSKVGPKESETTWKVTKFDAPKVQVHECEGNEFRARLTMQVEKGQSGSTLIHITEYALLPVVRPFGWLMEALFVHRQMTNSLRETVQNCRRLIEQGK